MTDRTLRWSVPDLYVYQICIYNTEFSDGQKFMCLSYISAQCCLKGRQKQYCYF